MFISDGAKALLSREIQGDAPVRGNTTSCSDHKGDSCVSRVFRNEEDSREWIRTVQEECNSLGSEITIRKMRIPAYGQKGDETNLVVVLNCYDLVLRAEPENELRATQTPGGVRVREIPQQPDEVDVEYQSELMGSMVGRVHYNGEHWKVVLNLQRPGHPTLEMDIIKARNFNSLQDTLEGIDQFVKNRERQEKGQLEKDRMKHDDAKSQIDGLFTANDNSPRG